MGWTIIKKNRRDLNAQFKLIKRAFDGVSDAKNEYEFCCNSVRDSSASMYQIKGKGVNVRFVGKVIDADYFILSFVGCGLKKVAPTIIELARKQGFASIKYQTCKKGMRRILNEFGFVHIDTNQHGETIHQLKL